MKCTETPAIPPPCTHAHTHAEQLRQTLVWYFPRPLLQHRKIQQHHQPQLSCSATLPKSKDPWSWKTRWIKITHQEKGQTFLKIKMIYSVFISLSGCLFNPQTHTLPLLFAPCQPHKRGWITPPSSLPFPTPKPARCNSAFQTRNTAGGERVSSSS